MKKYYTRACNFFFGSYSKKLVKNKSTLPLCGENSISFNQIEVCHNEYGKPSIKISKKLSKIIKEFMPDFSNYNIYLTITNEKKYSIAIVTLTK